jgi:hypothetical protein
MKCSSDKKSGDARLLADGIEERGCEVFQSRRGSRFFLSVVGVHIP